MTSSKTKRLSGLRTLKIAYSPIVSSNVTSQQLDLPHPAAALLQFTSCSLAVPGCAIDSLPDSTVVAVDA